MSRSQIFLTLQIKLILTQNWRETVNNNSLPCNGKWHYWEFQQDHQELAHRAKQVEFGLARSIQSCGYCRRSWLEDWNQPRQSENVSHQHAEAIFYRENEQKDVLRNVDKGSQEARITNVVGSENQEINQAASVACVLEDEETDEQLMMQIHCHYII